MINSTNITQYIEFLFQQKNGVSAPEEVLASWSNLNNEEVSMHLQTLYQHWSLPSTEIQLLEQKFSQLTVPTPKSTPIYAPPPLPVNTMNYGTPPPPQQQQYTAPAVLVKKNNTALIVIIVCLVAILIAGGFYFMSTRTPDNTSQNNLNNVPNVSNANNPTPSTNNTPTEAPVATASQPTFDNENDKQNAMTLYQLIEAENNQNFDVIYNQFSANMERYWNVNYPTFDELNDLYQKSWNSKSNIKQDNIRIEKVGENKYDVSMTYNAHDDTKNKKISKNVKTRYEFDNNNKIISTYGLNK